MKNYKIKYSNFYYKSNGKHIDEGEINKMGYQNLTESITIEKWSVDKINRLNNTNYNETNTEEILQFYFDENVRDIDYKVEIIKDKILS